MRNQHFARSAVLGLLALLLAAPAPATAQLSEETGTVATGLLLRQLDGVKRVLMIAAHPDDEDTSLLSTLSRGWGAETAYLSLTRGDGGQNLIGPELWEGLGIVRTGELLAARELDGGRQFFTRAFDYGYSKSADEALSLWPRDELLSDVVWVVRTYRPQVIVSVFSGTPSDGHGQHQAAGIMAREAFEAAADPSRFPEQLEAGVEAWAPEKLYVSSRRRFFNPTGPADDGSIDVATGVLDPLLGRSFHQLAMESRSQHRSQDMGTSEPPGPRLTGVILAESRVGDDEGFFSGVDTTLVGLADALPASSAGAARRHLSAYRSSLSRARASFGPDPATMVPDLLEARRHLTATRDLVADEGGAGELARVVDRRIELVDRTLTAAAGVSFQVRAQDDLVVPGQTVETVAQLWNGSGYTLSLPEAVVDGPAGWRVDERSVEGLTPEGTLAPGALATWTYDILVPEDAELSRLYYLEEERDGAMYRWPDERGLWGLPKDPPPVTGEARFALVGQGLEDDDSRLSVTADWRYVGVDPAEGQYEQPVLVVPAVSVSVSPSGVAWPQAREGAQTVSVVVRAEGEGGASGEVAVEAPPGWTVRPASQPFELAEAGAERSMTFDIEAEGTAPAGRHRFGVVATTDGGAVHDEGYTLIDYEHIDRTAFFEPAEAAVSVIPVAVPPDLRVGYIMGSGDDGPEAILQMGIDVEVLDEADVREGDFQRFSTVVLGVRAYETRPDLQAAASQLLDFVRNGGTVVVQYNRGPLGSLAPFELEVGRGSPRVADETAPVTMLAPSAPPFTTPNRITREDFQGWVQERGLYFASEWDDRYVPLLELNDPGEEPRRGSLLVAQVGDGVFAYTALSFFRQWAQQVPGAYRLFANLISLDADEWSAWARGR